MASLYPGAPALLIHSRVQWFYKNFCAQTTSVIASIVRLWGQSVLRWMKRADGRGGCRGIVGHLLDAQKFIGGSLVFDWCVLCLPITVNVFQRGSAALWVLPLWWTQKEPWIMHDPPEGRASSCITVLLTWSWQMRRLGNTLLLVPTRSRGKVTSKCINI